jgi:hypothetical protein
MCWGMPFHTIIDLLHTIPRTWTGGLDEDEEKEQKQFYQGSVHRMFLLDGGSSDESPPS